MMMVMMMNDNELLWCYGWLTKGVFPYFQPLPLLEILTIANHRHAMNKIWICAEPEFFLFLADKPLFHIKDQKLDEWCRRAFRALCNIQAGRLNFHLRFLTRFLMRLCVVLNVFKVNDKYTKKTFMIYSGVFITNFEHIECNLPFQLWTVICLFWSEMRMRKRSCFFS